MWGQAFLAALVAALGYTSNKFLGDAMLNRPLVMAALTGAVLGDPATGLAIGVVLELSCLGTMYLGLNMGSDVTAGAVIGTAAAVYAGGSGGLALVVSLPVGAVCAQIASYCEVQIGTRMSAANEAAANGQLGAVNRLHVYAGVLKTVVTTTVVWLLMLMTGWIAVGAEPMPPWVNQAFEGVAVLFPVLGIAMLINNLWSCRFFPFFLLGVVAVDYLGVGMVAAGCISVIIGLAQFYLSTESGQLLPPVSGAYKLLNRGDLRKIYWRSFFHEASYNTRQEQGLGFAYALTPVLNKLYAGNPEAHKLASMRHVEHFNLTVQITNFVVGIVAAFEEKNALSGDGTYDGMISTIKNAMMGPLATVGDAYFWNYFRILATAVGGALCLQGSWIGLALFVLIFNIPQVTVRWILLRFGYEIGENFLDFVSNSDIIRRLVDASLIAGQFIVGAMLSWFILRGHVLYIGSIAIGFPFVLFPSLVALVFTLLLAWLMRKKNVKLSTLIYMLFVVGLVLGGFGILV